MNIRVNGTHPDYSNLVAHYPLNEGIGSSANDNSPIIKLQFLMAMFFGSLQEESIFLNFLALLILDHI